MVFYYIVSEIKSHVPYVKLNMDMIVGLTQPFWNVGQAEVVEPTPANLQRQDGARDHGAKLSWEVDSVPETVRQGAANSVP